MSDPRKVLLIVYIQETENCLLEREILFRNMHHQQLILKVSEFVSNGVVTRVA